MKKTQQFVLNTAILTASSIIMQLINISFTVYLSGRIGAEGMGVYQLLMTFYGFAITLAISGIGLATTRLVAEELAVGASGGARRVIAACMRYALLFSLCAAALLWLGAEAIATHWLYGRVTALPVRVLCVSLPFMAVSAVFGGYFTAVRRVAKSASAQFMELLIRIGFSAYALTVWAHRGLDYACLALALGAAAAAVCGCLYLLALYLLDIRKHQRQKETRVNRALTRRVFSIALPVAVSSYIRSGLNSYKHAMIPGGLAQSGVSGDTAIAQYGTIRGMVMPVLMFPSALLAAFGALLVPEVAEHHIQQHTGDIHNIIARMLDITLVFSICVGGVMLAFSKELMQSIYGSAESALFLFLLAPLAPVMYLDGIVDSMLKGVDQQVYVVGVNILDTVTCIILLHVLLPRMGIMGYIAVIWVSELLNGALSLRRLIISTRFPFDWKRRVLLPVCAIAAAACAGRMLSINNIYISITITVILYAGILAAIRLFASTSRPGTASRTAGTASSDP